MAILFYTVVTPVAVLLRLFGADPLRRNMMPERISYWRGRTTPPVDRRPSMTGQYR